jgi:hypothetical protein
MSEPKKGHRFREWMEKVERGGGGDLIRFKKARRERTPEEQAALADKRLRKALLAKGLTDEQITSIWSASQA